MVDKDKIRFLIEEYYIVHWADVTINDDGTVDVMDRVTNEDSDVSLRRNSTSLMVTWGEEYGNFDAGSTGLTSLLGSPRKVWRSFDVGENKLTSLEGSPEWVGASFRCTDNKLTSLKGSPSYVGRDMLAANNPLKSLEGMPETLLGTVDVSYSRDLPLLRCLLAQRGTNIILGSDYLEQILNDPRWKGKGKQGAIPCATALIKAGFGAHAKW